MFVFDRDSHKSLNFIDFRRKGTHTNAVENNESTNQMEIETSVNELDFKGKY